MIGIGVIGYGYWGPNLVRNFAELPGARVRVVCDVRRRAARAGRAALSRRAGHDRRRRMLINDPAVDAVVDRDAGRAPFRAGDGGAARRQARAGREADGLDERRRRARLIDEAARRRLVLMVDHTFVYTGAVQQDARADRRSGELGDIYYYDSVRINLGLFQHDVNVLWDLAVHDLSIMDYVLPQQPGRRVGDRSRARAGPAARTSPT